MRKNIIFIALALLLVSTKLEAVKAYPNPLTLTQADGTTITVRLHGDEHFNYTTTKDGYLIRKDDKGVFRYAKLINGQFELLNQKANDLLKRDLSEKQLTNQLEKNPDFGSTLLSRRAQKINKISANATVSNQFPITGTPRSLVILVNFSDKSYVTPTPKTAFTDLLNKVGYSTNGGTGSARDYFIESSFGQFSPQFDVVGPFNLTPNMEYYGKNDTNDNDQNPQQLVIDACAAANAGGVDFTIYDTDNDGVVDNIFVYYAGYNEAEGAAATTIWPHRWSLGNYNTKFDGKIIFDYACTSELRSASGSNMCGIGTFTHEFGHVLGLADYYHTTEDKKTLENWSIMDGGAYLNQGRTPPSYSSFDRFYLGWLTPTELKTAQNGTLESLITSNKAYLISQNGNHNLNGDNPSPSEYFIIENRQKTGFDAFLPSAGMLIWHIDYNASAWNNNSPNNYTGTSQTASSHMRVYLQPLSGSTTTPGTAFTTGSFIPTLWNGTNINKPITGITVTNGVVDFRFMGGGNVPIITTKGTVETFSTVQGTPSVEQQFKITGKLLTSNLNLSFTTNTHFQMRKETDTENDWRSTISLASVSGLVDTTLILVRYNPTIPSYSSIHTDKIQIAATNAENQFINLNGTSTRKIYVVPPVATEGTEVSSGQYIANWNEVFDASGYYLTAYSIADGTSTHSEGFDAALIAPLDWIITATGVTTSAAFSGKSIPAIQLRKKDEYIQTEKYPTYASELSFFIKSIGSKTGILKVQGNGVNGWATIAEIAVSDSYTATKKYTLSALDKFTQFRLTYTQSDDFYIAIDDISVSFPVKLDYQLKNKWITETTDTLRNLISGISHFYKIKASDITLNLDKTIKYNNTTDYSNIIEVNTLHDTDKNKLRVERIGNSNEICVFLENKNNLVYIYNTSGQLITSINPIDLKVNISPYLKKHNLYLIMSGDKSNKVVF